MGRKYELENLHLLNLTGLGREPFVAEVLVKEDEDDAWLPIEVEGVAYFDPYNFDDTFRVDVYTDDPDLRVYLERRLKESFWDLVKKTLSR
ncbi:protein of unknown function (plasmid) [Thermococcus nautili]|nr:protein of unknown function [Thermococcus nautili]